MSAWDQAFQIVVGIEAGLSVDPKDPGNWTPQGVLRGTKYGISAHSFPNEDIANLTLDRAKLLAKPLFWDTIRGDLLPPSLALLMFDSSYNEGPPVAIRHLQLALGVLDDGDFGERTLAGVRSVSNAGHQPWLLAEYTTQRSLGYTRDTGFGTFGHSWIHRTVEVLMQAPGMTA